MFKPRAEVKFFVTIGSTLPRPFASTMIRTLEAREMPVSVNEFAGSNEDNSRPLLPYNLPLAYTYPRRSFRHNRQPIRQQCHSFAAPRLILESRNLWCAADRASLRIRSAVVCNAIARASSAASEIRYGVHQKKRARGNIALRVCGRTSSPPCPSEIIPWGRGAKYQ